MGLPGMNMGTPQGGQPCGGCGQPVIGQSIRGLLRNSDYVVACGKVWHPQHFVCGKCHNPFPNGQVILITSTIHKTVSRGKWSCLL